MSMKTEIKMETDEERREERGVSDNTMKQQKTIAGCFCLMFANSAFDTFIASQHAEFIACKQSDVYIEKQLIFIYSLLN